MKGLTAREVIERRQRGESNDVRLATSRSYVEIIRYNLLDFINVILLVLGAALFLIGRQSDALLTSVMVIGNILVGVVQEVRAKRKLDQIALLTRPQVTVLREGNTQTVDPAELVRDDIVVVQTGDQIVVDGILRGGGPLEVDESLLTGEADPIVKQIGDTLFSGSFCVAGQACVQAHSVGSASYANRLAASARRYQVRLTPLQREIRTVVRLLLLVGLFFSLIFYLSDWREPLPIVRRVQSYVAFASIVPTGIFITIIIAYALGAVRMAAHGALVQHANAVESLSHVDVLCVDKTGTLTANRLHYVDLCAYNLDKATVQSLVGDFAASVTTPNNTSKALAAGLAGRRQRLADEAPFSSARQWSAVVFDDAGRRGLYVLGALEALQPHLASDPDMVEQAATWSAKGLRVLAFAGAPTAMCLRNERGEPSLPSLTPLALLCLEDELRPYVKETIRQFVRAGVTLKVISGDNPDTVASLAQRAGIAYAQQAISGLALDTLSDAELAETVANNTVFGRISPEQKQRLIQALHRRGHYVAMIGDGVNDVLALKQASVSVAMGSGSSAARGVANIVLLRDSFEALARALVEGQRIVNGLTDTFCLFLTRTATLALLILPLAVLAGAIPALPAQTTVWTMLTSGVPALYLTAMAPSGRTSGRNSLRRLIWFVGPAAVVMAIFGVLIFASLHTVSLDAMQAMEPDVIQELTTWLEEALGYPFGGRITVYTMFGEWVGRTGLLSFEIFAGIILVLFVAPPHPFFAVVNPVRRDKTPTVLVIVLLGVAGFLMFSPLTDLPLSLATLPEIHLLALATTFIWMFVMRAVWRYRLFQRFLGLIE